MLNPNNKQEWNVFLWFSSRILLIFEYKKICGDATRKHGGEPDPPIWLLGRWMWVCLLKDPSKTKNTHIEGYRPWIETQPQCISLTHSRFKKVFVLKWCLIFFLICTTKRFLLTTFWTFHPLNYEEKNEWIATNEKALTWHPTRKLNTNTSCLSSIMQQSDFCL